MRTISKYLEHSGVCLTYTENNGKREMTLFDASGNKITLTHDYHELRFFLQDVDAKQQEWWKEDADYKEQERERQKRWEESRNERLDPDKKSSWWPF